MQSAMAVLVAVAGNIEKKTGVKPDHRLANYYWIETNLANTTGPDPLTSRRMSSAEFFAFLSSSEVASAAQMEILSGKQLLPSVGVDGLELPTANKGKVLVFEQAPNFSNVTTGSSVSTASKGKLEAIATMDTAYTAQPYRLVSPAGGWQLRSLFDPWGHELVYRYGCYAVELNAPLNTSETILGDDQQTPAWPGKAQGVVRPAVAEYGYPFFMSAGAGGVWGSFIDGTSPNFLRNATAADKRAVRDLDALDNIYSNEGNR